ncbi:DgyrCDS5096 [Dimorphilus gyrociliatus]|uniref:DgyrCDS5096 n=1 Tax=Dimorphilus gyrociliatus TaxID=2664684 RepID=A0A7I8VKE0_9ANNE|nr:DgyrCDS5096 [Dimorphilus gyrociliatus]
MTSKKSKGEIKDICNVNLIKPYDRKRLINSKDKIDNAISEFRVSLEELFAKFPSLNNCLNFECVVQSKEFQNYLIKAEHVAYIDLNLVHECTRKGLFLNCYNAWVFHTTLTERLCIIPDKDQRYNVGGLSFDASAIYNGILRCNRPYNSKGDVRFSEKDPRLKFSIQDNNFDERIHFALISKHEHPNPLRVYNALDWNLLDSQLQCQTFDALAKKFGYSRFRFKLPGVFDEYMDDFGENVEDCIKYVIERLLDGECNGGKVSVNFEFNIKPWALDSIRYNANIALNIKNGKIPRRDVDFDLLFSLWSESRAEYNFYRVTSQEQHFLDHFIYDQRISTYGKSSFILLSSLRNPKTKEILFENRTCLVAVDKKTRRSRELSDAILKTIKDEGAKFQPSNRISRLKAPSDVFQYKTIVSCEEVDWNMHVNQADYAKLCLNCASMALRKNFYTFFKEDIAHYHAKYVRKFHSGECVEGDALRIITWQNTSRPEIVYFIMYNDESNKQLCEVTIEFYADSLSLSKL